MRKLKLELDALEVQSFETASAPKESGTVHGRVATHTCDLQCAKTPDGTCNGAMTCSLWESCCESNCGYYTCAYGCPASVGDTCDPSCNWCLHTAEITCHCPVDDPLGGG